ncbi:hypothetical protein IAU60_001170 [Kwoniella sp. DSM 27419]
MSHAITPSQHTHDIEVGTQADSTSSHSARSELEKDFDKAAQDVFVQCKVVYGIAQRHKLSYKGLDDPVQYLSFSDCDQLLGADGNWVPISDTKLSRWEANDWNQPTVEQFKQYGENLEALQRNVTRRRDDLSTMLSARGVDVPRSFVKYVEAVVKGCEGVLDGDAGTETARHMYTARGAASQIMWAALTRSVLLSVKSTLESVSSAEATSKKWKNARAGLYRNINRTTDALCKLENLVDAKTKNTVLTAAKKLSRDDIEFQKAKMAAVRRAVAANGGATRYLTLYDLLRLREGSEHTADTTRASAEDAAKTANLLLSGGDTKGGDKHSRRGPHKGVLPQTERSVPVAERSSLVGSTAANVGATCVSGTAGDVDSPSQTITKLLDALTEGAAGDTPCLDDLDSDNPLIYEVNIKTGPTSARSALNKDVERARRDDPANSTYASEPDRSTAGRRWDAVSKLAAALEKRAGIAEAMLSDMSQEDETMFWREFQQRSLWYDCLRSQAEQEQRKLAYDCLKSQAERDRLVFSRIGSVAQSANLRLSGNVNSEQRSADRDTKSYETQLKEEDDRLEKLKNRLAASKYSDMTNVASLFALLEPADLPSSHSHGYDLLPEA